MSVRPLASRVLRKIIGPKYKPPLREDNRYFIQGSWMYVDDRDSLNLTKTGIYEPQETALIKKLIRPGYVVLDIGANIGYFTLLMAKQAKQVHAFEPEPRNFQTLQKNIELNKLSNVKLYNAGVAETIQRTTLHLCDTNRGMHRIYPSQWCNEGTTEIQLVKIDDLIENADFIKMDIEGAELGALKGMKKLLGMGDPTVMMEFHPPSIIEYGAKPRDVYDFMLEIGYDIKIPSMGEVSFEELEKTSIEKIGTNIICTKSHKG